MTCLEASTSDDALPRVESTEPNAASASATSARRVSDVEDEYAACLIATPSSAPARTPRTTCDAPAL